MMLPHQHRLASAMDDPAVLSLLEAHMEEREFGSTFIRSDTFKTPQELISFAETAVAGAYKGKDWIEQGSEHQISVRDNDGTIIFLRTDDRLDGQLIGESAPGSRVVVRIQFMEPIGRDALTECRPQEVRREPRTIGGRDETVSIVPGTAPMTTQMVVIGGPYGDTDTFGLYTLFPGRYAPPMSDETYWQQHGFFAN